MNLWKVGTSWISRKGNLRKGGGRVWPPYQLCDIQLSSPICLLLLNLKSYKRKRHSLGVISAHIIFKIFTSFLMLQPNLKQYYHSFLSSKSNCSFPLFYTPLFSPQQILPQQWLANVHIWKVHFHVIIICVSRK